MKDHRELCCVWFCCDLPKQAKTYKNTCQLMLNMYVIFLMIEKKYHIKCTCYQIVLPEPVGIKLCKQKKIIRYHHPTIISPSYSFHPSEKLGGKKKRKKKEKTIVLISHMSLKVIASAELPFTYTTRQHFVKWLR